MTILAGVCFLILAFIVYSAGLRAKCCSQVRTAARAVNNKRQKRFSGPILLLLLLSLLLLLLLLLSNTCCLLLLFIVDLNTKKRKRYTGARATLPRRFAYFNCAQIPTESPVDGGDKA